jgi:hypothetical protein
MTDEPTNVVEIKPRKGAGRRRPMSFETGSQLVRIRRLLEKFKELHKELEDFDQDEMGTAINERCIELGIEAARYPDDDDEDGLSILNKELIDCLPDFEDLPDLKDYEDTLALAIEMLTGPDPIGCFETFKRQQDADQPPLSGPGGMLV